MPQESRHWIIVSDTVIAIKDTQGYIPPRWRIALISMIPYNACWRPKRQPCKNDGICRENFSQGEFPWTDMIVFYLKVEFFSFAALFAGCCLSINVVCSAIRKRNKRQFTAAIETLNADPNAGQEVNTNQGYEANAFHVTKIQYFYAVSMNIVTARNTWIFYYKLHHYAGDTWPIWHCRKRTRKGFCLYYGVHRIWQVTTSF